MFAGSKDFVGLVLFGTPGEVGGCSHLKQLHKAAVNVDKCNLFASLCKHGNCIVVTCYTSNCSMRCVMMTGIEWTELDMLMILYQM